MLLSASFSLIESVFYAVPFALLPLLDSGARMDLIDLHRAKQTATVQNTLAGETRLEELSPTHIRLRYTPASTWQLNLLPDSTYQITRTFYGRDTSVVVQQYNKSWKLVRKK